MQKSSHHSMKPSSLNPSAGIFNIESKDRERSEEACRGFLRGNCKRGARCNFSHEGAPASRTPSRPSAPTHGQKCAHCEGFHKTEACWKKFPHLMPEHITQRPRRSQPPSSARKASAVFTLNAIKKALGNSKSVSSADLLALIAEETPVDDALYDDLLQD